MNRILGSPPAYLMPGSCRQWGPQNEVSSNSLQWEKRDENSRKWMRSRAVGTFLGVGGNPPQCRSRIHWWSLEGTTSQSQESKFYSFGLLILYQWTSAYLVLGLYKRQFPPVQDLDTSLERTTSQGQESCWDFCLKNMSDWWTKKCGSYFLRFGSDFLFLESAGNPVFIMIGNLD